MNTHYDSSEGIPFFSPKHRGSPGTPVNPDASTPTLFQPLTIRGTTLRNRIVVAPMCQFSTAEAGPQVGVLTPYHVMALGYYAFKGASLVFTEATSVQPNGRISPNCPGLWNDAQSDGVKAVADIIHSHGALCGLQLAHAGRKASTTAPIVAARYGLPSLKAPSDTGGWPGHVVGPSGGEAMIWDGSSGDDPKGGYHAPRELSIPEIEQLIRDWAYAAERAVRAGVDVLEIHAAHGYLIHQFLSPLTNLRTDRYGGSFENRTRLLVEIVLAIRATIPINVPLFLRLSATEWMDKTELGKTCGSWTVEDSVKVAKVVADLGVDLLDVSSGGNHREQTVQMFAHADRDYQVKIAHRIRRELRLAQKDMLIGAVGLITEAEHARDILDTIARQAEVAKSMTEPTPSKEPMADVILVARQFLREPEWVLRVAWKLGVDVYWPNQSGRARFV